ncbi:MAG: ribonuclease HI [Planctomycetes bacterium]|nr:ribonuclease HI [Planctomycetota bacterium]
MAEPYDVILHTDGACSGNPGPGGWAYLLVHPATERIEKHADAEPRTTNNRMELVAVIRGLETLKPTRRWRVKVVSDSTYVVHGMTEWLPNWLANNWRRGRKAGAGPVKNADLWKQLHALSQRFDVTFEHIKAHAGHPANEECDRMAVAAIKHLPES